MASDMANIGNVKGLVLQWTPYIARVFSFNLYVIDK